jgi:hypothetical protein
MEHCIEARSSALTPQTLAPHGDMLVDWAGG